MTTGFLGDWLRRWRGQELTRPALVMGRRVGPVRGRQYPVQVDVHFEHLGSSRHATVESGLFDDPVAARMALARWPIGSACRVRYAVDQPENVRLV
jgi:hypothetical protein